MGGQQSERSVKALPAEICGFVTAAAGHDLRYALELRDRLHHTSRPARRRAVACPLAPPAPATQQRSPATTHMLEQLLQECSGADLHTALALLAKLRARGAPTAALQRSLVLAPAAALRRRRRRLLGKQLAFSRAADAAPSAGAARATAAAGSCPAPERAPAGPAAAAPNSSDWRELPADVLLRCAALLPERALLTSACACAAWRCALGAGVRALSFAWCPREHCSHEGQVVSGAALTFTSLHTLALKSCLLAPASVQALVAANGATLARLDLSHCAQLDDAAAAAIAAACPRLRVLDLSGNARLGDAAFAALGRGCSELVKLNACACERLGDAGLAQLAAGARQLADVNLGWCEALTGAGVTALAAACPRLTALHLCGCLRVGDEGVAALAAGCPALARLGLHCCRRLTDAAMAALAARLTALSTLNVSGCMGLSAPAVQAVVDANPGLHTCAAHRSLILSGCLRLLAPPGGRAVTCACALPC